MDVTYAVVIFTLLLWEILDLFLRFDMIGKIPHQVRIYVLSGQWMTATIRYSPHVRSL